MTSRISIITYVHCSKENGRLSQLKECVESIKSQKYPNLEHIIVDDGSTVDILDGIQYPDILYIRKSRTGIVDSTETFNTGFIRMTGDYGIILSSDDVQMPGALNTLSSYLDNHPEAIAVVGSSIYTDIRKGTKRAIIVRGSVDKDKLLKGDFINGCAIMFRKTGLDGITLPEDQCGSASDWDMWLKLSEIGNIYQIPDIILNYRDFGNATRHVTKNTVKKSQSRQFVIQSAMRRRMRK